MISENKNKLSEERKSRILQLYNCEDNPLKYLIKPKASVKITNSKDVTEKDFLVND